MRLKLDLKLFIDDDLQPIEWSLAQSKLIFFPVQYDPSRWGGGSDGHLYDFAKRFDDSRLGGGSDGLLGRSPQIYTVRQCVT